MDTHTVELRTAELLAHSAWIRRLARQLLADAAAADDVVQEALFAALRRPPAAGRPLKPWLAQVTRNLARQRLRFEAARQEREELSARSEAQPGPSEVLERLESQRELVEAVRTLAEPHRTTVLLRYMEGLSCARIARRQGVPGATVRSRLKRGLDELRRVLVARRDGDRRTFAVGLLALASPDRAGLLSTLGGTLAMQAATKLGLTAVAVVAAAAGLWVAFRVHEGETTLGSAAAALEHGSTAARPAEDVSDGETLAGAGSEQRGEIVQDPEAAEGTEGVSPRPTELERLRENLRRVTEGTLSGALDPEAFLKAGLSLLNLEVDDRPLSEPDLLGGLQYPLVGTPQGVQAALVVHRMNHSEYSDPWLTLVVHVDPPSEPYVFQGSARRDAQARLSVLTDQEGRLQSFTIRTRFEPARDPADPKAHIRATFMEGLSYYLDVEKPFDWSAKAYGLRMLGGTPERATFTSEPWDIPITLTGRPWPPMDDLERFSRALLAKYRDVERRR